MKTIIAGGTGFLGRALTTALIADGHDVVLLSRRVDTPVPAGARSVGWDPSRAINPWASEIDGASVVVNLAGEPIAAHRWTAAQKRRIEDSRVVATQRLVSAVAEASRPPAVFVSGSGVGFYGPCGDEFVTEDTGAGHDFLAAVCRRWEAQAVEASRPGTRVVCVRTGLVLGLEGGALPQMLLPFRLFVGGRLGSGRQYWPWIHLDDWVRLVRFAIDTPEVAGPVNASAPEPVTNAVFARALGRALGRPAFVPTPRLVLSIVLGEMADALLLSGQRAVPAKVHDLGFTFTYPTLATALAALFPKQ